MKAEQKKEPNPYSPERENRVAEALRENLRKRKAQQQTRASSTPSTSIED